MGRSSAASTKKTSKRLSKKAATESEASPKLGEILEKYFAVRAKRLDADRKAEELKSEELLLEERCKREMFHANLDQAKCRAGLFTMRTVSVPRVEDWDSLYGWIIRHKHPEILFRRVNNQSVSEILEHEPRLKDRGIPGLGFVKVVKVTATARK